jgi:hypothetical protein
MATLWLLVPRLDTQGSVTMDIKAILLERPGTLIPILAAVEFVLLVRWSRRRTRSSGRVVLGGLLASALMIVMQSVIVTDGERVRDVCRRLSAAVARGDVNDIGRVIADDFTYRENGITWRKADLLTNIERALIRWDVQEDRLRGFETTVDGPRSVVSFRAVCRLIGDDFTLARHVSEWRLELVEKNDEWKVTAIKPKRSRMLPADSLADLLR